MSEGQMKYEALKLMIDDPVIVENAEKLVMIAYDMSTSTALPMYQCWYYLIESVRTLNAGDSVIVPVNP